MVAFALMGVRIGGISTFLRDVRPASHGWAIIGKRGRSWAQHPCHYTCQTGNRVRNRVSPSDSTPVSTESRPSGLSLRAASENGFSQACFGFTPQASRLFVDPTHPRWHQVVRADDPWARFSRVSVADLALRQLVLLTPDLRPRALLDGAFDAAGLSYDSTVEVTNAQEAQAVAAAGRGVAVVSDDTRFGLVPLHIDGPAGPVQIRLFAAWDPRHHAASALATLADRLATFCVGRYGEQVRSPQ